MKIENQICSSRLARKLERLGFRYESYFVYANGILCERHSLESLSQFESYYAVLTVAELGEILPREIEICINDVCFSYYLNMKKTPGGHLVSYDSSPNDPRYSLLKQKNLHFVIDTREADCRTDMLIYLIEHGYMNGPVVL